jgi:excisionase family DNA binding protein
MTLTDVEVGVELRIGKTRVRELIKSGEIPSVMIGGTLLRVRRADLEAYLAQLPATQLLANQSDRSAA